MIVKELIEELKKMPEDAEVITEGRDCLDCYDCDCDLCYEKVRGVELVQRRQDEPFVYLHRTRLS